MAFHVFLEKFLICGVYFSASCIILLLAVSKMLQKAETAAKRALLEPCFLFNDTGVINGVITEKWFVIIDKRCLPLLVLEFFA